jgi:hypothetical protein
MRLKAEASIRPTHLSDRLGFFDSMFPPAATAEAAGVVVKLSGASTGPK